MIKLDQNFEISTGKLKELFYNTADISILLDREGVIKDIFINKNFKITSNTRAWLNKNIVEFLTLESIEKIKHFLVSAWEKPDKVKQPIELNHVDEKNWEFPVEYTFTIINDSTVLVSGRDLKNIAEIQQQLIRAQLSVEKEYEKFKGHDTRFRVMLENTDESIIILDAYTGQITDTNHSAASLLGLDLMTISNIELHGALKNQEKDTLLFNLKTQNGKGPLDQDEYILKNNNVKVTITSTVFRANNNLLILCKLRPISSKLSTSQELVSALRVLYDKSPDGIIFTNKNGLIWYANESFLSICDVAETGDIRSKSLGDFLNRGTVDMKVLLENTLSKGSMQFYSSKIRTNFGRQTSVDISATYLGERNNPTFAFVIKDVSHFDTERAGIDAVSEQALQNVMKLVGSAPLKELVADTSDVVERLCIETAIELTGNNKVAAADMLGVSRQSLYVKLRKYDLMSKDPHAQ